MFEYRQVPTRMRLGDTDRAIARAGLMGRRKVAQLRRTAEAAGWLDVATALPDDPGLAVHLGSARTQPAVASLADPHRERITRWWRQGIQGTTIHGALVRSHGFTGSYSSVRRFLAGLEGAHPQATTVLEFDPGEAAQVDFGKGPEVLDPRTSAHTARSPTRPRTSWQTAQGRHAGPEAREPGFPRPRWSKIGDMSTHQNLLVLDGPTSRVKVMERGRAAWLRHRQCTTIQTGPASGSWSPTGASPREGRI